jgi:hypothetical protein
MTEPIQFVVNERGEKIAAIISIEEYEKILEKLGNSEAIRTFKKAMSSVEPRTPSKKPLAGIEPSS